jgi:hypothetical protein
MSRAAIVSPPDAADAASQYRVVVFGIGSDYPR